MKSTGTRTVPAHEPYGTLKGMHTISCDPVVKEHAENPQSAGMHVTKTSHAGDVIRTSTYRSLKDLDLIDNLLQ